MGSMKEAFAAAARVWPDVRVDEDAFAAFLAERLEEPPSDEIAADLLLVCGCVAGDTAAMRGFEKGYLADVPKMIAKVETDPASVDEVQQKLRERMLLPREDGPPRLAAYQGRGRLGSWLRVAAIRLALDGKSRRPSVPPEDVDEVLASPSPELDYLRARYRDAFRDAFSAALSGLEARDRTVLRMHLVDGLSIDRIGQVYDVHRATAARWLERAREGLFTSTRDHLRARLGVSADEFQSIVRLVRSELDLSVGRLLVEDP